MNLEGSHLQSCQGKQHQPIDTATTNTSLCPAHLGCLIQRIQSTTGQILEMHFSRSENKITSAFLGHSQSTDSVPFATDPVPLEQLPRDFKLIKTEAGFSTYFRTVCTRFTIWSDGSLEFPIRGIGLGGNSYTVALNTLKVNLKDLANPIVYDEIAEKMNSLTDQPLKNEGCLLDLLDIPMPVEMRICIEHLSEEISTKLKASPEECESIEIAIRNDLKKILEDLKLEMKQKREKYPLWEALEVLYRLKAIRELPNELIREIYKLADQQDSKLCDFVPNVLKKQFLSPQRTASPRSPATSSNPRVKEIDDQLANSDWGDLHSLLLEVNEGKPQKKEGIDSFWENEPAFFVEKTLVLIDPKTQESYGGMIKECSRHPGGKSGFHFVLKNETEVRISLTSKKTYEVSVAQKVPCPFWKAIQNKFIEPNEIFDLRIASERANGPILLPSLYKISEIRESDDKKKGSSEQPYTEIKLIDGKTNENRYSLRVYHADNGKKEGIEVYRWNVQQGLFSEIEGSFLVPFVTFNRVCSIAKTVTTAIKGIQSSNVEEFVKINNDGEDNDQTAIFDEIQASLTTLRQYLLLKQNQEILRDLRDHLIATRLEKIELSTISHLPELEEQLRELSSKYQKLEQSHSPEELLKSLVKDALYVLQVDQENSLSTFRTMSLMTRSDEYTSQLQGAKAVFLAGSTGDGKTTMAAYFGGFAPKIYKNSFGIPVVKVENPKSDTPEIGVGMESQTLHTRGYTVDREKNHMIVDTPGFDENRGIIEAMLGAHSFDSGIQAIQEIKALGLVVPIQAFLEKANPLFDLFERIIERFPHVYDPTKGKVHPNVHLLVTKQEQVSEETAKNLKDKQKGIGKKILEERNKAQKKVRDLLEQKKMTLELRTAQHQLAAWNFFRDLIHNERVHFAKVDNNRAKNQLLDLFFKHDSHIEKDKYIPAMQSREMQAKFGDLVETSTFTLLQRLFVPYLEKVPHAIKSHETSIEEKSQQSENLQNQLQPKQELLKEAEERLQNLNGMIKQLKEAIENPTEMDPALKKEFQKKIEEANDARMAGLKKEIVLNEESIEDKKGQLARLKMEIQETKKSLEEADENLIALRGEVNELSQGETTKVLGGIKYRPEDKIDLKSTEEGMMKTAFKQYRRLNKGEYTSKEVLAKDYVGTLYHLITLDSEYIVAPTDKEHKKSFLETGKAGRYEASIEGHGYKLIEKEAKPGGKNICYLISTEWKKGGIMPWFTIRHTIPKAEFHVYTIMNLENRIMILNQSIERLKMELEGSKEVPGLLARKKVLKKELKQMQSVVAEKKRQIEELNQSLANEEVKAMLESQETSRNATEKDIATLRLEIEQIPHLAEQLKKEIESERRNIQRLWDKKITLALLIHDQLEMARLVRNVCNSVTDHPKEKETSSSNSYFSERKGLVEVCSEYELYYDKNIEAIQQECLKDLKLGKSEKEKEAGA
jgi:hypothetical protein